MNQTDTNDKKKMQKIRHDNWPGCPSQLGMKVCTDQLVSDLVHHVGVVKSSSLVLPPAFDVDAWLLFKVGKVKVIPVKYKHKDSAYSLKPQTVMYTKQIFISSRLPSQYLR